MILYSGEIPVADSPLKNIKHLKAYWLVSIPQSLTITHVSLSSRSAFMCSVRISIQNTDFCLYNIKWLSEFYLFTSCCTSELS